MVQELDARLNGLTGETKVINRRAVLTSGLAAGSCAVVACLRPAQAQASYPERPIRLIIPFPPGGVYDAIGRPWADRMKSMLGTVVPENVGGAAGSVGAAMAARAAPDGYTLLLGGGGTHVINPAAASRPQYNPAKDFDPIAILAATGLVFAAHPSFPAKTLGELVAFAKANPDKLSYGSAGVGSFNHLTWELFRSLTGIPEIVHVPYRGGGPALTDVLSGHIPLAILNVTGQVVALGQTDKLRLIAATTPARMISLPDTPTAVEAGLAGMIAQNFLGLFAPAGTPKPIMAQLSQATRTTMADPAFRDLLVRSGFEPQPDSSPEAARRIVEEEIARWTPVIKAVGLRLD
jgi:tripartite-type tricarboxylate transporter receptor subunit TctC